VIEYYKTKYDIFKVGDNEVCLDYRVYMYNSKTKKWEISILTKRGIFMKEITQLTLLDLDMLGVPE